MARLLLKDLTPGTAYKVQVRSKSGDSVSEWSRRFDVTTTTDNTPPDVPSWAVTNDWVVSDDTFVASWQPLDFNLTNNKDFAYYELSITNGVTSRTFKTTNTSFTLTFEQNKFYWNTPQATLSAQVRSVDQVGNRSAYNTLKSATNPAPAAPATIATTALYDSIKVDWSPVADTDLLYYRLFVSTTSASTGFSQVYEGPNVSHTYSTVAFATDHWFRVIAVDKFGTASPTTTSGAVRPKSAVVVDTTPPNDPTGVTLTKGFDATKQDSWINVAWTASTSTDVDRYEIRYSTVAGSAWQYISAGRDVNSVRIEGLVPNTAYYVDVRAVDFSTNVSAWVNQSANYPYTTDRDTTAPSQPAAASVSTGSQRLQVSISGNKAAGGAMESDVAYYEVYAGTTNSFTPSTSNMIGTIQQGPAMVETFQIPASSASGSSQDWYVIVRAVDRSSNTSPYSPVSSVAAVGLILTANIGDATITSAKITTITAGQITAGTISSQTINIGASGVLNVDATGVIKSNNYSAGNAGYQLSNTGLEINSGSISASALRLQVGQNIAPAKYADFEAQPSSYTPLTSVSGITTSILQPGEPGYTAARFNNQHLRASWASALASAPAVFFTDTAGDYNINVEANTRYIVSAYVWNTGTVATNVQLRVWFVNSSAPNTVLLDAQAATATIPANTPVGSAVRLSGFVDAPSGANEAVILVQSSTTAAGGGWNIDGIQFERKTGLQDVASEWRSPSTTSIDGGLIRTGEIRSNSNFTINGVKLPTWSVNTAGDAQFSNMYIRGTAIVGYDASEEQGVASPLQAGSKIQSGNYSPGETGWAVFSNGFAEFRNIVVGSLPGNAVEPGTLSADAIQTGSVLAADVTVTGALHAKGDMGEDIGLTGDGFLVLGPHQVGIVTCEVTSNVAKLTTSVNHGFSVGKKLVVEDVGVPFNGVWTTKAGTTGNVIYFDVTSPDIATSSGAAGKAKSLSTDSSVIATQPRLIEFPTDGANPNIISGELKADNLTVVKGGSIMGPVSIDNTNMIIGAGVVAPRTAPTVTNGYATTQRSNNTLGSYIYSITRGHNGNWFALGHDGTNILIEEYSFSTGASLSVTNLGPLNTSTTVIGETLTRDYRPRGLHYDPSRNKYFYGYTYVQTGGIGRPPAAGWTPVRVEYIDTMDTSFATQFSYSILTDSGNDDGYRGSTIGWDHVGNRAMHIITTLSAVTVRYLTTNATTGEITAVAASRALNQLSAGGASVSFTDPRFLCRVNNGEFGAERIITKDTRSTGATGTYANNIHRFTPFDTSNGNPIVNEQWLPLSSSATYAATYVAADNTFYALTSSGFIKYEGGESWWNNNSSQTVNKYVAYSFYDSVPTATLTVSNKSASGGVATLTTSTAHGLTTANDVGRWVEVEGVDSTFNGWAQITEVPSTTTFRYARTGTVTSTASSGTVKYKVHETNLSPVKTHPLQKRARMNVNINAIPKYVGEYPDKARIYVANAGNSAYYRRAVIDYPATSGFIVPAILSSGDAPMPGNSNGFTIVNSPSKLMTTDGNYYLDGTGVLVVNKYTAVSQPYAFGYRSASAGSFANGVWSAFGTPDSQTLQGGITYDIPNGRYIVAEAGLYQIEGQALFAGNATGYRGFGFALLNSAGANILNGPLYSYSVPNSTQPCTARCAAVVKLSAGDQIGPIVNQSSGGALGLNIGSPGFNFVSVVKVA